MEITRKELEAFLEAKNDFSARKDQLGQPAYKNPMMPHLNSLEEKLKAAVSEQTA